MSEPARDKQRAGQRRPTVKTRVWPSTILGLFVLSLLAGGIGAWGATAPLASAVVARGEVTVDTNRKHVQHLEGGIVAQLNVRDGDAVHSGDILLRLDETRAKATLAIVDAAYREERAKEARYIAERDEKEHIAWPADLVENAEQPEITVLLESQEAIFVSRRETLNGEVAILTERISQLKQEVTGFAAQRSATEKQLDLINEELAALFELMEKGQTTKPRILALQRSAAGLDGEHGSLTAKIAGAEKAIGETKLEIIQKRKAFRNEVVTTLRDIQSKLADLRERRVATQDILDRLDIRAPVSGKVVGLSVHAKNAIIRPGDTILEIVPIGDRLLIEVQIQPQDVDNVEIGQSAEIHLLAFRQKTTPTLMGRVTYISADVLTSERDGSKHYIVRVSVPEAELLRLEDRELQPGMPAEVLIRTGERTAIAYLMQPIVESMNRAWREE